MNQDATLAIGTIVKDREDNYYKIVGGKNNWYECRRWCSHWNWSNKNDRSFEWTEPIYGFPHKRVHSTMTVVPRLEVLIVLGVACGSTNQT